MVFLENVSLKTLLTFVSGFGVGGVLAVLARYWSKTKQYRFKKLHNKRLNVIREIYRKITRTEDVFRTLLSSIDPAREANIDEARDEVASVANDLYDYFRKNRIYFEDNLADEIDFLIEQLKKIWHDFSYDVYPNLGEKKIAQWNKIWKEQLDYQIPLLKLRIECRFRNIIGIEKKACWWEVLKFRISRWWKKIRSKREHYEEDDNSH